MHTILNVVVPLFSLMALGYLSVRVGLLSDAVGDGLARFVFVVAVPVLLFRTLANVSFGNANPLYLWASYFIPVAIVWTIGTLVVRRLTGANHRTGVIAGVSSGFANTAFLALPVLQRAYGDPGLEPLLLIISIHLPVMMIASTLLIERAAALDMKESGEGDPDMPPAPPSLRETARRVIKNLLTNAIVVGILCGLLWRLTGVPLEGHLDEIAKLLGGTAGPLALFALGMSLPRYGLKGDILPAAVVSLLSLVVMPALVWVSTTRLHLPPQWIRSAVITAAAPLGVNAYLLAVYFKAGEKLAATATLMSTVAAVVTMSVWLTILQG
ncbi:AEC family transporter [Jiella sp. M17.18]|uniref:AEC family transporter n=1 Tax=Jiella sp. M17.18 TaxID=3234247 RepID=UPI0034DE9A69